MIEWVVRVRGWLGCFGLWLAICGFAEVGFRFERGDEVGGSVDVCGLEE